VKLRSQGRPTTSRCGNPLPLNAVVRAAGREGSADLRHEGGLHGVSRRGRYWGLADRTKKPNSPGTNEFVYIPTRLGLDIAPTETGAPVTQPSCL
jgi:hypothetical protein